MKIGTLDITNCKIGSTQVNEVRIGSTLVWQFSSVDPDAQAFITAAGITNPTQQTAINTLVVSLKANGLWTKMKALYPFIGGNATSHKFNLKDPRDLDAAFRLSFLGGWTHSSTGAKPNGTNGYANTFFMPSVQQSVNSNGLGVYTTLNTIGGDPVIMGAYTSPTQASSLVISSTSMGGRLNATIFSASISGGEGSFDIQRTGPTITKLYKNGALLNTGNIGGTLPNYNVYLGCLNLIGSFYGPVNSEFRLAYLSEGLTDTDISNLRNSVQAYETTLGRQV